VAVVGLPILQLHQHRVVLRRPQQGQRQHRLLDSVYL
jgi:hypothetical protein